MTIILCMVPEISKERTEFFVILEHFLPFYPPNNPKHQNFEKMKKMPGDIIILQKWTIDDNHMMYCSWMWSMTDRIFCHFGPFFALLPHKNPKNHNFEKLKKKCLEISSFYNSLPKIMIICYTVEIWCVIDVFIFHFGSFFALLPPPP